MGCCPNAGWFCCPGDEYCAASEEYCKKTNIAEKLISMAAAKKIVKQDCEGTVCPGGCCPNAGWFCCPGDEYCAASEEYCKKADFGKILLSMAAPKKIVKKEAKQDVADRLIAMAAPKRLSKGTKQDCEGTVC